MTDPFVVAADIGGTKMEIATIDVNGVPSSEIHRIPVPFIGGQASLEKILDILEEYVEKASKSDANFRGLGLSSCGLVDLETGNVVVSPNQHWYGVPLRSSAEERFSVPVYAATDTRLAVLGEAAWGEGKHVKNFAWVTLGTGFGAAFFLNGRLYGGERGFAGAFGHNTVDEVNGYPCGCGRRGCLETYASGRALARQAKAAVDMGHETILRDMSREKTLSAKMVFDAKEKGDATAVHLVNQLVRYAGIGISQLINILDINLIIMGGGLTKAGDGFIGEIEAEAKKHLFNAEAAKDIRITKESLPNSAMFGAAANVFMHRGDLEKLW